MRKLITVINIFLRAFILSPVFLCAVIFMFVVSFTGPAIHGIYVDNSLSDLIFNKSLFLSVLQNNSCNSFSVFLDFDSSKWYCVCLPISIALPIIYGYENIDCNIKKYLVPKLGIKRYSLAVCIAAAISGISVVCLGVCLYGISAYIILPEITQINDIYVYEAFGSNSFERMGLFLQKMSDLIVVSIILGMLAVIMYHKVHDKFLSITIPMMVMYLSGKLFLLHNNARYDGLTIEEIMNMKPDYMLMLFPSNLTELYLYMPKELNINYLWFFAVMLFIAIMLYAAYVKTIKRNLLN